jgi:hypothetical protein
MLVVLVLGSSCLRSTVAVGDDATVASHSRSAQVLASLSVTGELEVGAGSSGRQLRVSVVADPEGASLFPEDNFTLRVHPPDQALEPLVMSFVSTYGLFELGVFDLTNDQVPDIILVTGVGRGTSVRGEILRVFDCASGTFHVILEEGVSGWFGSSAHWSYQRSILTRVAGNTSLLRLVLEHDIPGQSRLEDVTFLPADSVRDYAYDRQAKQMKLIGRVARRASTSNSRLQRSLLWTFSSSSRLMPSSATRDRRLASGWKSWPLPITS